MTFVNVFRKNKYLILIFILAFFVFFTNYKPKTYLSGWDNLMPELNPILNIKRSLFAVWQEYQGLGLLGGMAHAADLPRQILILFLSFIIPLPLIRYISTFSMLVLGALGIYCFLARLKVSKPGRLGGSIFYLLNLATLQTFFVPFEAFTYFYGFLPWFFYFADRFLATGKKKNLFLFLAISFLGTTAFYVQTLFVVYSILLFLFILSWLFLTRQKPFRLKMRRIFKLGLTVFAANAFWLIPVVYFTITSGYVTANSKINSIATPETQLMNQARNSPKDVITLKGFWFDYFDYDRKTGEFDYLYKDWINHIDNPQVNLVLLVISLVAVLGIILAFFFGKNKRLFLITGFAFSFLMLSSGHPVFGFLYKILSDKLPLFSDIFRNVYTKWSISLAFFLSIGVGIFIGGWQKLLRGAVSLLFLFLFTVGSIFVMYPVFEGKLISDSMKVNIPPHYFQLFEFLNKQENLNKRIALLPAHNLWGWQFFDWGYQGSGFIWYGIGNPILDRAFDVWSPYNESFYNELSFAFSYGSEEDLERVFTKYNVSFIIFDESLINPGLDEQYQLGPRQKNKIDNLSNLTLIQKLGPISVFEYQKAKDFVFTPQTFVFLENEILFQNTDILFKKFNDYLYLPGSTFYPFVAFNKGSQLKIKIENESIVFEDTKKNAKVVTPVNLIYKENFSAEQGFKETRNCDLKKRGTVVRKKQERLQVFYGAYDSASVCDFFYVPQLPNNQPFILRIKGKNITGRPLKIYLDDPLNKLIIMEELLPKGEFDIFEVFTGSSNLTDTQKQIGYTLAVETRAFGKIASENVIEEISFYPIDIDFLASLNTQGRLPEKNRNALRILDTQKLNIWLYKVKVSGSGLLALSQGYDPGWIALRFSESGLQQLPHFKLNSWANAFMISHQDSEQQTPSKTSTVYIIYLPQLLEFIGLTTLIIGFIILSPRISIKQPIISLKKRLLK